MKIRNMYDCMSMRILKYIWLVSVLLSSPRTLLIIFSVLRRKKVRMVEIDKLNFKLGDLSSKHEVLYVLCFISLLNIYTHNTGFVPARTAVNMPAGQEGIRGDVKIHEC